MVNDAAVEAGRTPGEWKAVRGRYSWDVVALGSTVASIPVIGDGTEGADARLCAASPDLLAAAASLLEFWDHGTPVHPGAEIVADLRAAVAKAVGEPAAAAAPIAPEFGGEG